MKSHKLWNRISGNDGKRIFQVFRERELLFNGYVLSPIDFLGEIRAKTFRCACAKICRINGLPYDKKRNETNGLRLFQSYQEANNASKERYVPDYSCWPDLFVRKEEQDGLD